MKNSTRKVSPTSKTKFNVAHENMLYNIVTFALAAVNIAITQSITAFYTLITTIQSNLATVASLRAVTTSPITGYASQKKALRTALVAITTDIMNAAYSFAIDTDNTVLAEQMSKPASHLNGGDRQLIQFVNGAIQNVTPFANAGTLQPYNVTAASVSTWQSVVDQLNALMSNPQNAIANRVAINKNIYQLLNECMFMLTNNSDTLINQFRVSNPAYYNTYWANRRLNEHHVSTQLRLYVLDQLGHPVTQGEVLIIGTDRSGTLDLNGYCLVDQIPFGTHQFALTTPTFEKVYGPYDFKKGHSITLHVQISNTGALVKETSTVTKTEETVAVTK